MRAGLALTALMGLVLLVYTPAISTGFCGYDDFMEIYRAASIDSDKPVEMFTTLHMGTPKYRPLNRALIWATYQLAHDATWVYRLRNVLGLIGVMGAVFALSRQAGRSGMGAALAAGCLGLHPLAHQTTAAASWTITTAAAAMMWSWKFYLDAWNERRPLRPAMVAAFLFLLALFLYEATVVLVGLLGVEVVLRWWWKQTPAAGWRTYLARLVPGVMAPAVAMFGARMLVVHQGMALASPGMIVKNLAMYAGSLMLPVDLLLLNSVADMPLPGELTRDWVWLLGLGGFVVVILLVMGGVLLRFRRERREPLDWPRLACWVVGIPIVLSPYLFNSEHASETYMIFPLMLFVLLVCSLMENWIEPRAAAITGMVAITLFASAGWLRSQRVAACGAITRKIFATLPMEQLRQGAPVVYARNPRDYQPQPRFGLYNNRGLGTIDVQSGEIRSLEAALRLMTGNRQLHAEALPQRESFPASCGQPAVYCFIVEPDGQTIAAQKETPNP